MKYKHFLVQPGQKISLKDYDPKYTDDFYQKSDAQLKLQEGIEEMRKDQDMLYADNKYALLIIFQAMDAAGKDSTIKYVMSGVNPQGCQVFNFKTPSQEELDHDYLWRYCKSLPERGRIGIFNRSYYEEVLIVRVHPEILQAQQLPYIPPNNQIWQQRFREINNFEQYLTNNGIIILKFFLHISKQEQKKRFLKRIEQPEKNWKFTLSDVEERAYWDDYMHAYEDAFNHTSTEWAPWYIVPSDRKWFARLVVAGIICHTLQKLNLSYPQISHEQRQHLLTAKAMLEAETD
ncbi:polyphosphate kinase 2 family protein [Calothrix sp. NIES-3974]|uniref:polyphosphate kinase 2 family protein n=1 Tax=Calothrix sp. NIES-3974 TaxID=2005462 RepID=UPI000B61DFEE|nr:polyphosphate kinase 2 family protein [Calothrix sp. NIES-3974]BAZ07836.1 polyphosphate:AMP phosphotransferase [Calothrix sp. NIES-3974]